MSSRVIVGHVWKPNVALHRTAYLMLLATVVLWALNFTVTKYVLEHGFQPLAYSTVRYGIATIIFTWFTFGVERSFHVRRQHVWLLVAAAALGIWLNQISYVYALEYSSASTIALILGATPIFTALIAFAIGLERLHRALLDRCGRVVRRRRADRARQVRRRVGQPQGRCARRRDGGDLGRVHGRDRAADAQLLAVPDQRARARDRLGRRRADGYLADGAPVVRPQHARVGLPRLRRASGRSC